ncbi:MAG: hypothetical protein ACK5L7_04515 [Paludibacteraceae bacterium]
MAGNAKSNSEPFVISKNVSGAPPFLQRMLLPHVAQISITGVFSPSLA